MWYNKTTNELQSCPPWTCYLHHDLIQEIYAEWKEVTDTFIPVIEKSPNERIAEVESAYTEKLKALTDMLVVYALAGKDTADLKAQYQTLVDEKDLKMLEILEGL